MYSRGRYTLGQQVAWQVGMVPFPGSTISGIFHDDECDVSVDGLRNGMA